MGIPRGLNDGGAKPQMKSRLVCFATLLAVTHAATWEKVSLAGTDTNALCLDGSPGMFYLSKGSSNANWLLVFEGGGWCYSASDCYLRGYTAIGSSTNSFVSQSTAQLMYGPFSPDCSINPEFCDYNIVELHYCDGFSFLGNSTFTSFDYIEFSRTQIASYKTMYSRGRAILQATMDKLLADHGLANADKLLLSGCSAGGTSALVNADYVKSYLSKSVALSTYKVLALSGIFGVSIANVNGVQVMQTQIQSAYSLAGASANIDSACSASVGSFDSWKCATGAGICPFVSSPVMVMNSIYDKWQAGCIYGATDQGVAPSTVMNNGACSSIASWQNCLGPATNGNSPTDIYSVFEFSPNNCSSDQVVKYNTDWNSAYLSLIQGSATYSKAGNGAFLHTCFEHCGEMWDGSDLELNAYAGESVDTYNSIKVQGSTAYAALRKWWSASTTDDAKNHRYTPCKWNDQGLHDTLCNPSCLHYDIKRLSKPEKVGIAIGAVAGVFLVS